jgi:two-component system cell cycle sensor histidine kinase/response regulator CckA
MLGLVELLLGEIEPGTKPHERLLLVQQSGLEIKRITHALLGFARAEPGAVDVLTLADVATDAAELVRCTNAGNSVEIREQYPEEPLVVHGSPARLAQVFLTLLLNAQQALPDGGAVTVRLERDQDWALATVSHSGREASGTTLWLEAGAEIAHMHGGDLVSLPSVGAGVTYILRLPLTEPAT